MKIFEGKVISTQMNNTVVVEIFRTTPHPLYKKLVRRSKKYKVDNVGFEKVTVGSVVKIQETKPMSKYKYFKISSIIKMGEDSIPVKAEVKTIEASEKVVAKVNIKKPAKKTLKKESK